MDMSSHAMYFQDQLPIHIVFEEWMVKETSGLITSCFGIAVLAAVYEVLKRTRMELRRQHQDRLRKQISTPEEKRDSQLFTALWMLHLLNSLLYAIQIFSGYLFMLIVMTYNSWLFLSVVVGLFLGYAVSNIVTSKGSRDQSKTYPSMNLETVDGKVKSQGRDNGGMKTDLSDYDF